MAPLLVVPVSIRLPRDAPSPIIPVKGRYNTTANVGP